MKVDTLVTDFGTFPMPKDLGELWEKAPKRKIWVDPPCECCGSGYWDKVIDDRTKAGKAFWRRHEEISGALEVIYCLGWDVEAREL